MISPLFEKFSRYQWSDDAPVSCKRTPRKIHAVASTLHDDECFLNKNSWAKCGRLEFMAPVIGEHYYKTLWAGTVQLQEKSWKYPEMSKYSFELVSALGKNAGILFVSQNDLDCLWNFEAACQDMHKCEKLILNSSYNKDNSILW